MISIPIDYGLNRSRLVRPCSPPRQSRGGSSNLNRPLNFFRQEMTTQDQAHRLLLAVKRPASRGPNVICRGHEQSIGELRTVRFGQERVDFSLGDRPVGMIRLGLNGPQFSGPRASDDVDPRIRPPPLRPILPQPNLVELTAIPWSVFQEPPAQPLEVATKRRPLGITANLRFDVLEGSGGGRYLLVDFHGRSRLVDSSMKSGITIGTTDLRPRGVAEVEPDRGDSSARVQRSRVLPVCGRGCDRQRPQSAWTSHRSVD